MLSDILFSHFFEFLTKRAIGRTFQNREKRVKLEVSIHEVYNRVINLETGMNMRVTADETRVTGHDMQDE